jgi:hypothetical protein
LLSLRVATARRAAALSEFPDVPPELPCIDSAFWHMIDGTPNEMANRARSEAHSDRIDLCLLGEVDRSRSRGQQMGNRSRAAIRHKGGAVVKEELASNTRREERKRRLLATGRSAPPEAFDERFEITRRRGEADEHVSPCYRAYLYCLNDERRRRSGRGW